VPVHPGTAAVEQDRPAGIAPIRRISRNGGLNRSLSGHYRLTEPFLASLKAVLAGRPGEPDLQVVAHVTTAELFTDQSLQTSDRLGQYMITRESRLFAIP
jgi:hypothetical protein